jgi:hypothetical protein
MVVIPQAERESKSFVFLQDLDSNVRKNQNLFQLFFWVGTILYRKNSMIILILTFNKVVIETR